jgi:predicted metal-dependent HD superfamily phosphohydrolase
MSEEAILKAQRELRKHVIVRETLDLLARDLPDSLWYHALPHTEDVLDEVIRFGITDNLSPRDLELLAIAAACHDVGFVSTPTLNESLGAAFAREQMERHSGFSSEEIALVERMILDTALITTDVGPRQVPTTRLSGYLLDADLSNLGREDFFDKGELQRKELGQDLDLFRRNALALLLAHQWNTSAGRLLRQTRKEHNFQLLSAMVHPR